MFDVFSNSEVSFWQYIYIPLDAYFDYSLDW